MSIEHEIRDEMFYAFLERAGNGCLFLVRFLLGSRNYFFVDVVDERKVKNIMDVINRQAAINDAESQVAVDEYEKHLQRDVIKWLKKFPSAQSEIIYCKDCKYKDDGIDENGIPFPKCLHGRSYGGTRINDFCSWAEKKEDAESRWIPVTEKLPEEDKDVLCKTLAGVIFVASYGKLHRWTDEKGWIITPSLKRSGISFVDWWMPLPEFYKEGEK